MFTYCKANYTSCEVGDGKAYGGFSDIPITWWKMSTVLSGIGVVGLAFSFFTACYVVLGNVVASQVRCDVARACSFPARHRGLRESGARV